MKNRKLPQILILFLIIPQVVFAVYGEDSRKDFYELKNSQIEDLSNAMLYRIDKHELRGWTFRRYWKIITASLASKDICQDEKFSKQDTIRLGCSAVLIARDKVLTGGSCISNFTCKNDLYYWTLGYYKKDKDQRFNQLPRKNFYKCKKLLRRVYYPDRGISYAIFSLNKSVVNAKPVVISKNNLGTNEELIVMGHPEGLPLKISDGAKVLDQNEKLFISNSDIRGETVGAMAFSAKTKELVGMMIYGTANYSYPLEGSCRRVPREDNNQGQELFLKSNVFIDQYNQ